MANFGGDNRQHVRIRVSFVAASRHAILIVRICGRSPPAADLRPASGSALGSGGNWVGARTSSHPAPPRCLTGSPLCGSRVGHGGAAAPS